MAGGLAGRRVVVVNWRDLEHPLAGGSEIYAWQFARALSERGAEVTYLTSRTPGRARSEQYDDVRVHRGGGVFTFYLFAAWWLLRHRWRLDAVIDPSGGLPSFSPLFVSRRTPVLLVIHHVHQQQFGVHFPAPLAVLGQWLERVMMPRVYYRRRTVAVSHSTRLEMRRQLAWTMPIGLLENGADVPETPVDPRRKDPDRVVALGRLVAHKRIDLVLRAFGDAVEHEDLAGRRLHLDVVGRGPEQERLTALAAELGLADRVTFHGFASVATKQALLERASVHVCASDAEGWGQAVIEAAAWGVPTVARDVPGLRDSVRPGETGWLVADATDLDVVRRRLAGALVRALCGATSAGVRAHRVSACQAWARRFDWERMRSQAAARTEEIIRDRRRAGRTVRSTRSSDPARAAHAAIAER